MNHENKPKKKIDEAFLREAARKYSELAKSGELRKHIALRHGVIPLQLKTTKTAEPSTDSVEEMCSTSRELNKKSIEEELEFYDKYIGRQIQSIKAWGTDEYDFTPDVLGSGSFSVGEFGYVDLNFDSQHLYLSTDGMRDIVPARPDVYELPVDLSVEEMLIGAKLEKVKLCAGGYVFYFSGLPVVRCTIWNNDGHCDRDYLEFDFMLDEEL